MNEETTLLATNPGFADAVRKTIEHRISLLSSDDGSGMYAELEAFVNRTDRIVRDYNGRQVFEMLQNMDDQMRNDVSDEDRCSEVLLDKNCGTLSFRNKGRPFSFGGIVSILRPDVSPKEREQTIGNKGLGFRSLVNWNPAELVIRTGHIDLVFSGESAKGILKNNDTFRQAVEKLRYKGKELPILSVPAIKENDGSSEWTTEIELRGLGEKAIAAIESELRDFRSETLLFLPNLRKVEIKINGGGSVDTVYSTGQWMERAPNIFLRTISVKSGTGPEQSTSWLAFRKSGQLDGVPDTAEGGSRYNVAIAVPQDDMGWNGSRELRNYLPVRNVEIEIPCLVHATVALNDTRDGLPPSNSANEKIFSKELPDAIKTFAEYLRNESLAGPSFVNDRWFPWRLLSPPEKSSNRYVGLLYAALHTRRDSGEFVPCVDGLFRNPDDSRFFANTVSRNEIDTFFNRHPTLLPNHVLSDNQSPVPESFGDHPCESGELEKAINGSLQSVEFSDDELAELAHLLWSIRQNGGLDSENRFLILRDKEGRFFKTDETVYTPSDGTTIKLPDFMSCGFLSNSLWTAIQHSFAREIEEYRTERPKSFKREFCEKILSLVVSIDYFDKATVTKKLVSECRRLLGIEMDIGRKRSLVLQLLRSLYDNFKNEEAGAPLDDELDENVPPDDEEGAETIDYREKLGLPVEVKNDGTIIEAGDLLFDSARQFYGDTLENELFLEDHRAKELLGGAIEDNFRIHSFFRTFGVREDVRVRYAALSRQADKDYLHFLVEKGKNNGGLPYPSGEPLPDKPRQICCRLRDADLVRGLSDETLLDLLVFSARKGLADFLAEETRIIWKGYNGKKYYPEAVNWSYCAYQLAHSRKDLILEDIDLTMRKAEKEMARKHGTLSLPLILERMGARQSLEDLSPKELYEKMAAFNSREGVQKFYKRIRDALNAHLDRVGNGSSERENAESEFAQLAKEKLTTLWARKGNGPLERVEREKIRYWDNATLSQNILADCWKLEIGQRVGAASVEKLFGVKNLDSSSAKLLEDKTVDAESLTKELTDRLSSRLVILLAIRCRDLSSHDEINRAASTLRLLPGIVRVVSSGAFLFEDRPYELANGDLIQTENGFVICSTAPNLKLALQNQTFCVAIGEMLGIRLRLTDSLAISAMRNAVKCSLEEMETIRHSDLTESDWALATEALGLGEEEKRIWLARLGRPLDPNDEGGLAFLGSRQETIRKLTGRELPDDVPTDIPLGNMDNAQTDAFVRWLQVPADALGERTVEKLRTLRRDRFEKLLKESAIAGFVATNIHRHLEEDPADKRRKYIPLILRFQEDSNWFSDRLDKLLAEKPLADDSALWGVLKDSVQQEFTVQLPETAEGCEGSSMPEAGTTYLDILREAGMELSGLEASERSLAFFTGNEDAFRMIVERAQRTEDESTALEQNGIVPENQATSIQILSSVGELPFFVVCSHGESSGSSHLAGKAIHYPSDKRKHQIGKRAEEMVWKAIKNNTDTYRNPQAWSSLLNKTGTANDSLHYDISYQTPNNEDRYVEVKAFDGHEFFMSNGEYEFATDTKNYDKYILALVNGDAIRFIEAPFAPDSPFKDVIFPMVSEYKCHFERQTSLSTFPAPPSVEGPASPAAVPPESTP